MYSSRQGSHKDMSLTIPSNVAQFAHFTGEELQVKFLVDPGENTLRH
jgi:hypothetical protein